jgi:hypothetical protein
MEQLLMPMEQLLMPMASLLRLRSSSFSQEDVLRTENTELPNANRRARMQKDLLLTPSELLPPRWSAPIAKRAAPLA